MLTRIIANARRRLKADAKDTFLQYVQRILSKYGIKAPTGQYPKVYKKDDASSGDAQSIRKDFEAFGFKFKKFAYQPGVDSVEASGIYRNIEYILDIIAHGSDLEVQVYY